jgi:hypothetical protein
MTQYVGCDHARTLLEGLIDGELSMAEQLAVESHLRWCETCALRVEDMRTIGAALRAESTVPPIGDVSNDSLTAMTEGVLVRVRAERDQSFPARVREMVTDRRLLWPALGATSAVLLCVAATFSVLHASISRTPESLAAMISALGSPGSIQRPLRPADNGITIPRLIDDDVFTGQAIESFPEDDMIYAVQTVVGSDGNVAWAKLLSYEALAGSEAEAQETALLNAVRKTRFSPAQTPLGHAVAVDVVLLIAKTTAVAPAPVEPRMPIAVRAKELPKPPAPEPAGTPLSSQPAELDPSATA